MKSLIILSIILLAGTNLSNAQHLQERTFIPVKKSITWGDFIPGRMAADSFKKQNQIKLPAGYTLKKAVIFFAGANFTTVETYNMYTTDLLPLKDAINKCGPGTVVYIEKVLVTDINKQEAFLSNAGFVLY